LCPGEPVTIRPKKYQPVTWTAGKTKKRSRKGKETAKYQIVSKTDGDCAVKLKLELQRSPGTLQPI
jgi:hypothetical protein